MGFFGGASGKEKKNFEAASQTAQDRFSNSSNWATGQRDHTSQFGNDIRQRGTERQAMLWDSLWGDGANANAGGGGGGGGYRGDPNSIWGSLRDTGDLTGGDWDKSRGVYTDFADTGGFSEGDKANLRGRALAGTDTYDPSSRAGSRVQGGWGGGTGASSLQERKAIAEGRNRGAWNAEAKISDDTRSGRQWGATSLEGLGGRVQAGRIQGQSKMDAERARRAASRRAGAASAQADDNRRWGRSMQLMDFDQNRLGRGGADLQYDAAGQAAAGRGFAAADTTMGRNQANAGWGGQLMSMIGQGVGAAAGLPSFGGGGRKPRNTYAGGVA